MSGLVVCPASSPSASDRSNATTASCIDAGVVANLEADGARFRTELEEVFAALEQVAPERRRWPPTRAAFRAERERVTDGALGRRRRTPRRRAPPPRCVASCDRSAPASSAASRISGARRRGADELRGQARGSFEPNRSGCAATARRRRRWSRRSSIRSKRPSRPASTAEAAFERVYGRRHDASEQASRSAARVEALQLALDAATRACRCGAPRRRRRCARHAAGRWSTSTPAGRRRSKPRSARRSPRSSSTVRLGAAGARRPARVEHQRRRAGGRGRAASGRAAPSVGEAVLPHVRVRTTGCDRACSTALVGRAVRVDSTSTRRSTPPSLIPTRSSSPRAATDSPRPVGASGPQRVARRRRRWPTHRERADSAVAALAAADERARAKHANASRPARKQRRDLTRQLDQNDARFTAASEGLARALGQRRETQAELEGLDRTVAELTEHIER